jgi:Leucine-rich repeat (LRR) protein
MYNISQNNALELLKPIKNHPSLNEIDLGSNQIRDISELGHLQGLTNLRTLTLKRNPVTMLPSTSWAPTITEISPNAQYGLSFRLKAIYMLPKLTGLFFFR